MKSLRLSVASFLGFVALTSAGHAQSIRLINSFSDPILTKGAELTFMQTQAPADAPIELVMYTVTVSETQIQFELKDHSAASDLVFPEGRQDIWYIALDGASSYQVSPKSDANFVAEGLAVAAGTVLEFDGAFREGLELAYPLDQAGIRVTLGEGTDLTPLGTSWRIDFE